VTFVRWDDSAAAGPSNRARSVSNSARSASWEALYAERRARITISITNPALDARSALSSVNRVSSRRVRFRRLRRTAVCPCFGTMNPIRLFGPSRVSTRMSRYALRTFLPSRASACSSAPRVSRYRRVSRRLAFDDESGAGVLTRQLNREALSSLPPTATEYFASPPRRHALAETVRANASLVAGTIRGLAHENSKVLT